MKYLITAGGGGQSTQITKSTCHQLIKGLEDFQTVLRCKGRKNISWMKICQQNPNQMLFTKDHLKNVFNRCSNQVLFRSESTAESHANEVAYPYSCWSATDLDSVFWVCSLWKWMRKGIDRRHGQAASLRLPLCCWSSVYRKRSRNFLLVKKGKKHFPSGNL